MSSKTQTKLDKIKAEITALEETAAPTAEIDAKRDEYKQLIMAAMGLDPGDARAKLDRLTELSQELPGGYR